MFSFISPPFRAKDSRTCRKARVEFNVEQGPKGLQAADVVVIG